MIREDLSEEGTFEQAMHRWGRGRAFLAEGRQFQSPEEGTSWHIEEAETHEAEMSKGESGRDEIERKAGARQPRALFFPLRVKGGPWCVCSTGRGIRLSTLLLCSKSTVGWHNWSHPGAVTWNR